MNWDEWRGSLDGRPALFIKRLLRLGGFSLDLHKFVRPDDEGCFHTHPAWAVRVVLAGGYEEQVWVPARITFFRAWRPGSIGIVRPSYCHRVSKIANGVASYSLWLRGPSRHDVRLVGSGWSPSNVDSVRSLSIEDTRRLLRAEEPIHVKNLAEAEDIFRHRHDEDRG